MKKGDGEKVKSEVDVWLAQVNQRSWPCVYQENFCRQRKAERAAQHSNGKKKKRVAIGALCCAIELQSKSAYSGKKQKKKGEKS